MEKIKKGKDKNIKDTDGIYEKPVYSGTCLRTPMVLRNSQSQKNVDWK